MTNRRSKSSLEIPAQIPGVIVQQERIKTSDGQELGAWFIPSDADTPSVLLLHGVGGCRGDYKPMIDRLARDKFGILAITFRGHGDSTGEKCDFGYSARLDAMAGVEFLEKHRPGHRIVVVGTSLGAAAAMFASKDLGTRVDGYLLESPYVDLTTAIRNRLDMHLSPPFNLIAWLGLKTWSPIVLPVSIDEISPINAAKNVPPSIPVSILTGELDHHATPLEAEEIFDVLRAHATLTKFPNGHHATLYADDPETYYAELTKLLNPPKSSKP